MRKEHVGCAKGRVAAAAIGKWQQVKKPSVEVAMRPLAGPPRLVESACEMPQRGILEVSVDLPTRHAVERLDVVLLIVVRTTAH